MYRNIFIKFIFSSFLFVFGCENLDPKDFPNLKIADMVKGKGSRTVESGDTVKVYYVGKFTNGQVFDSNYEKPKPKRFPMRSTTLIKGWRVGILGMKQGGKRKLTIPPELAFGEKGKFGRIPPNSTLIFEIELVEIE